MLKTFLIFNAMLTQSNIYFDRLYLPILTGGNEV